MSALKAIGLTSPTTQASGRFFFGCSFAQGEVPASQYLHLDTPAYSATVINTWPDGSVCLGVFTGTAPFTANVEKQVNVVSRSYAPTSGTALTAADITASGAAANVQFGSIGSSTLAGATLVQTHYSDSQMVCCEYRGKAGVSGAAAKLSAQYFVWLFADGKRFMRVTPWNGFAFDGAVQQDYVPTVTIDGVVVFDNSGAIYHHSANTWYTLTRWSSGSTITPRHDTTKLIESGLVPNYTKDVPQSANSTYLTDASVYTPGSRLAYAPQMGATGGQDQIGILPLWDAMYFVNRAEKVAYDAVIAGANAIGTYSPFHTDPVTFRPIKISDYPTHTQYGAGQGGGGQYGSIAQDGTTQFVFDLSHHPGAGYLAAIITGDPFYMQICQYIANTCYLSQTGLSGSGVNRIMYGQERGIGWTLRSISNAIRVCPSNQSGYYDHNIWYSNLMISYSDRYDLVTGVSGFKVGMLDEYVNYGGNGFNAAGVPLWQNDFVTMSVGQAIRMQVGTSTGRAKALNFLTYLSNHVKWRTDPTYFTYPANYYFAIPKSTPISDTGPLAAADANPSSAADIYALNLTSDEMATLGDNILHSGGSTGTGPGSYWDQFMCSVAYCVDNNLPGAVAGLARIQGATNYASTIGAIDRATTPVFAISPVSVTHATTFTAVDSGAIMATAGPSFVWDNVPLISGAFVWDTYRGLGIPAADIPTGFTYPALLANDVDAINDPAGTEYRVGEVVFASSAIEVVIGNHSEITVTAADGVSAPPDGTYTGTQNVYKNGVADAGAISITVGVADTTIPVMVGTLASSSVTSSGFTLTWSAATDNTAVTGYEVSTNNGTSYVDAGNVLTVAKTGLTASTTYNTKVRAYDAANNKATPLSLNVATSAASDTTAPIMSGSLTVSLITSSGFTIGWSAASDNIAVTGYELSTDNGSSYTSVGNVLTYTCTGKASSTLYNVKVRAYDAANNKATPLSTTATTSASSDVTAPALSGVITISAITTGGFTASWNVATDAVGVTGYEISVDAGTPAYTSVGNVLTTTKTALSSATLYNVRVRAFDAAGNRSTAITTTVTTATPTTYASSVTLTFQDRNGTLRANLTGMKWAFFDQATPDVLGIPSAKGTLATTNSAGVATLNITGTQLAPGAIGWLIFSNSDGTATQSNLISFAGPCVTA